MTTSVPRKVVNIEPKVVQIAAAPAVIGAGQAIKVTAEAAKPASAAGSTAKNGGSSSPSASVRVGSPVVAASAAASGYVTAGGKDIKAKYEIDPREIGHGHYGVVRKARSRETGETFAIKTIRKSKVSRLDSLRREIDILHTVDHPQIIKVRVCACVLACVPACVPARVRFLHGACLDSSITGTPIAQLVDVYEDDKFLHLVTELCTGGEVRTCVCGAGERRCLSV